MQHACSRRSDSRYPATSSSSGSPRGALRTNRTGVPATKPSSRSLRATSEPLSTFTTVASSPGSSVSSGRHSPLLLIAPPCTKLYLATRSQVQRAKASLSQKSLPNTRVQHHNRPGTNVCSPRFRWDRRDSENTPRAANPLRRAPRLRSPVLPVDNRRPCRTPCPPASPPHGDRQPCPLQEAQSGVILPPRILSGAVQSARDGTREGSRGNRDADTRTPW
jgi:hypothetical protein